MKEQDAPDAEQRHDIATEFEYEVVDEVHHSDGEVVHDGQRHENQEARARAPWQHPQHHNNKCHAQQD